MRKVLLASFLGSGLEYYDFVICAMLAPDLSMLFFPTADPLLARIQTLMVFAVGYLARPIGGLLFGVWGDLRGRKTAFFTVMLLMAATTFGIGLIPVYEQWGVFSAYLLVGFRVLQGLSFGGELPGAITFVVEHAGDGKQAQSCGFVMAGVAMGSALASGVVALLHYTLSGEQILRFGWRIPFFLGGALAILSFFVRTRLGETPVFENQKDQSLLAPLTELAKNHIRLLFSGFVIASFVASLVIFSLYFPTFLSAHFRFEPTKVYSANTWSLLWAAMLYPCFGYLSDTIGHKKVFIATGVVFCLLNPLFIYLLKGGSDTGLNLFVILYQTVEAPFVVSYLALLAKMFPISSRCSGVALCYNGAYSCAAFLPASIAYLSQVGISSDVVLYVVFSFLVGMAFLATLQVRSLRPL